MASTSPTTPARAAILATLASAASTHATQHQHLAGDLHANAAALANQEADVQKQTAALAKEGARWQGEVDRATKGLKEFGDLQNWAEMMERDFLVLEETLRVVEGDAEEEGETASGGSRWRH